MTPDESRLIEKLRLIEALFAGTTFGGERDAAVEARKRVLERLEEIRKSDPPVEFRFTLADSWSRRLFVALLRRYAIHPYRYAYQRRTTVVARVSRRFVDETLMPEFRELERELRSYLDEMTRRIIERVIEADSSEAVEVVAPREIDG